MGQRARGGERWALVPRGDLALVTAWQAVCKAVPPSATSLSPLPQTPQHRLLGLPAGATVAFHIRLVKHRDPLLFRQPPAVAPHGPWNDIHPHMAPSVPRAPTAILCFLLLWTRLFCIHGVTHTVWPSVSGFFPESCFRGPPCLSVRRCFAPGWGGPCSVVWLEHSSSVHSSAEGRLGRFRLRPL